MGTQLKPPARKPRINFRPVLYFALGLMFGILLYTRIRFGGFKASDCLFLLLFPLFSIRPVSLKRTAAVFVSLLFFAGIGTLSIHLYTQNFLSGLPAGEYEVTATVNSFTVGNGYTGVTLNGISLNGESVSGKMSATLKGEEFRAGDVISFHGTLSRTPLPHDSYGEYLFANDIRYTATVSGEVAVTGKSSNLFLRLNASIYNVLHANMDTHEADMGYALLTGNSGSIDDGLLTAVRQGGIAHIFAVSGLHIGILYAAVSLLGKRLGKYRFLPATALAVCYCALCGFTVSSVRAVIMCTVLGIYGAFGRKYDFLSSIAFAALSVLLFMPAQFLTAGFRLSFGACVGLALFTKPISQALKKLPAFLKNYLAASVSVQLFTFPILYDSFGYFSVWGMLLNFVLIPLLPVVFLGLFCCSILALVIPPAAFVFLAFPQAMLSLLLLTFSAVDFSFVLTGFSLGAGSAVWTIASVALSEKVRFPWRIRAGIAAGTAVLFVACVVLRNAVFTGCKITVSKDCAAALVRTQGEAVLIVGDSATLSSCEELLNRNYGGTLSAIVVAASDELNGINVAAFLPAEKIFAFAEIPTGLRQTEITFATKFSVGEIAFRYEGESKLAVFTEGLVIEVDFALKPALGADLFVGAESLGEVYYIRSGTAYKIFE